MFMSYQIMPAPSFTINCDDNHTQTSIYGWRQYFLVPHTCGSFTSVRLGVSGLRWALHGTRRVLLGKQIPIWCIPMSPNDHCDCDRHFRKSMIGGLEKHKSCSCKWYPYAAMYLSHTRTPAHGVHGKVIQFCPATLFTESSSRFIWLQWMSLIWKSALSWDR